jgi:hypothetical protein
VLVEDAVSPGLMFGSVRRRLDRSVEEVLCTPLSLDEWPFEIQINDSAILVHGDYLQILAPSNLAGALHSLLLLDPIGRLWILVPREYCSTP